MAEARKAVLCLGSMEWGTPVLHLRAENGVLFALPEQAERKEPELAAAKPPELDPPVERKAELVATPKQGDTMTDAITGMEFVYIPAGCFMMGSPEDEEGRKQNEGPLHEVYVDGFWMGKYPVMQGQWKKIMGKNPSYFQGFVLPERSDKYPAECISWDGAQEFISALNKQYRLPTEAEWEYACRAGSSGKWHDHDLDKIAWYGGGTIHPVGEKKANVFGLHDMLGNVCEWCADWYDSYPAGKQMNPRGPKTGSLRVCRGGNWGRASKFARAAYRDMVPPDYNSIASGFRLVLPSRQIEK